MPKQELINKALKNFLSKNKGLKATVENFTVKIYLDNPYIKRVINKYDLQDFVNQWENPSYTHILVKNIKYKINQLK